MWLDYPAVLFNQDEFLDRPPASGLDAGKENTRPDFSSGIVLAEPLHRMGSGRQIVVQDSGNPAAAEVEDFHPGTNSCAVPLRNDERDFRARRP